MWHLVSGKTTVARVIGEHLGASVISLDEINLRRGLHSGQGVDLTEWQQTHQTARAESRAVIEVGGVAVIDDTSSPRFCGTAGGSSPKTSPASCNWCTSRRTERQS